MAFDGITLNTIISELQNVLICGKVNKIYEPNSNNVIISIYNKKTFMLNIDTTANNYSIYTSTHQKENPYNAPNFCMTLRKYLNSSEITNIYMKGLERICYIDFKCYNEMNDEVIRTLAIELMGKYSNIVLLNENKIIIDALKKFDTESNFRDIMPARKYVEPDITKKDFINETENNFIKTIMRSDYKTLETAIPNLYNGICKMFIQSVIEKLTITNTISEKNLKEIYTYIKNILKYNESVSKNKINIGEDNEVLIKKFKNNYSVFYCHVKDEEKNQNIEKQNVAIKDRKIDDKKEANNTKENDYTYLLNNNFFLDDFYYDKENNETYIQYRNTLLKILNGTLDKLLKKMDNINSKIDDCKNMDLYKTYGELLIANIYKFKKLTDEKEVEVFNYYDNTNVKIPIDSSKSISQNAEKYFKKYNKMKKTMEVVKIQKKETNKELDYLESLIQEMDNCSNINDVDEVYNEISENILFSDVNFKNKHKKDKKQDVSSLSNYIKTQVDDFDVLIGKNNKQNDYITFKVANENDYWFHAKDIHGSHLILRCNGITPKISTIEKCAKLCAYYSKAKFSSHVPVDYALRKHVKKPHGAVPGYVIYTTNKTIYVDPSKEI